VGEDVEHDDAAQGMADDGHASATFGEGRVLLAVLEEPGADHVRCMTQAAMCDTCPNQRRVTRAAHDSLVIQLLRAVPQHARMQRPARVVKNVKHGSAEEGPVPAAKCYTLSVWESVTICRDAKREMRVPRQGGQRTQRNLLVAAAARPANVVTKSQKARACCYTNTRQKRVSCCYKTTQQTSCSSCNET